MPDQLRSSHEDKLIDLSKQYNRAFASKNLGKLDELFSPKVVYHADKVTLQENLEGRSTVLAYLKDFFAKYDYDRNEVFGAVDHNDYIAFSVTVDKGVAPKQGVHDEQKNDGKAKPGNVINLTALFFDKGNLIQHIYVARQLSIDEAHRKLKKVPDYSGSSFNPEKLGNDDLEPSSDRAKMHERFADLWSQQFTQNDISNAERILDPNVKIHQLLTSDETNGLEDWKKGLANIFKDWECKGHRHHIAVTPGNKAFVWWETTGITKGEWTTVWGITVLIFNKEKISEVASIYQPFPGMREALVQGTPSN